MQFLEALNEEQGDDALRQPVWAAKWNTLAVKEPGYIVNLLRRKLLDQIERDGRVEKPLGFVAAVAKRKL